MPVSDAGPAGSDPALGLLLAPPLGLEKFIGSWAERQGAVAGMGLLPEEAPSLLPLSPPNSRQKEKAGEGASEDRLPTGICPD